MECEEAVIVDGAIDIDARDGDDPQLCAEYAPSMYSYLRTLDDNFPMQEDFLKRYYNIVIYSWIIFYFSCSVNGEMRGDLVNWLVQMHSMFHLSEDTLFMTINMVDKFLQVVTWIWIMLL